MRIEWRTGRPEKDGTYDVIYSHGCLSTIDYTVNYGWNTTGDWNHEHAMPDEDIALWAERFGDEIIDILRRRVIISDMEVTDAEGLQHDTDGAVAGDQL